MSKIDKGALLAVIVIALHSLIPLIIYYGLYHGWITIPGITF